MKLGPLHFAKKSCVKGGLIQEPLKPWTELYIELNPNGGLELVFLLLWYK